MKKIPLWIWIMLGLVLGVIWGTIAVSFHLQEFTSDYIKPWGKIFVKLLKLIAIPLILFSLVNGISSLGNISRLGKLGGKTIIFYICTTVIAISIGLLMANTIKPGNAFPGELKTKLENSYASQMQEDVGEAESVKSRGPLHFIEEMVPDNIFGALSTNTAMLQVIFFAVLFAIALMSINKEKAGVILKAVDSLNDIILRMVDIIMYFAPVGVLGLIAGMITDIAGDNIASVLQLFEALAWYMFTVLSGLFFLVFIIYPVFITLLARRNAVQFYRGIFPAQLLAFSTSSSAATLPVTMECCENNLKIKHEVARFVLPVGATINMDGTSLYQAVATIFIAQVFGNDLGFSAQLTIILTATMASIGSAAVPGAGIIMLVMVLQSVGLSVQGISLIIAVDRVLDMFRTVVNVTGDSMICTILNRFQN